MSTLLDTFITTEPRGKQRPRFVRATGRTYTPTETVKAEHQIQARASEEYPRLPYEGPVELRVSVFLLKPKSKPKTRPCFPTSKPDWDNYGKLVSDALNGIVWRDDAQVTRATVDKRYCSEEHPKPGFRITVLAVDLGEVAP